MSAASGMGLESRLVDARLKRGCRCFVGIDTDSVVAYAWLSRGSEWIGELRREIRCRDKEAYVWNCVTLPQHRLRGWFRGLLAFVVCRAQEEGATRMWIASVGGAEKAVLDCGFAPAVMVDKRTLGGVGRLVARRPAGADDELFADGCAALGFRRTSAVGWARRRVH